MFPDVADKPTRRRGYATSVVHETGFELARGVGAKLFSGMRKKYNEGSD
jgi:hypothetical protein